MISRWSNVVYVTRRSAAAFVALSMFVAGCASNPGALEITVHPRKPSFAVDEPIEVDVRIVAHDGPVCIARSHWFDIDLSRVSGSERSYKGSEKGPFCSDSLAAFFPWAALVPMLDVADLGGNFNVISQGQPMAAYLKVTHGGKRTMRGSPARAVPVHDGPRRVAPPIRMPWQPGEYELTASLINRHVGNWPPPFFWKPYRYPISATTKITIVE